MDQLPQGQPTQQPVQPAMPQAAMPQPAMPQAASPIPPAQPALLTPSISSPSKLKNPKLWIGVGVGLLIIIMVTALFMGKPSLFPGRVPTDEEIAGCARLPTKERCINPRLGGICEWVQLPNGKVTCQAVGIGAVPPAAEAPPAETPPPAEEPAPAEAPPAETPVAEAPQAEPQAEERAAAPTRCGDLTTQALCQNPRFADRCEWGTSKEGKQQCQTKERVAVQPAAAPPPTEEPAPAEAPPAETPATPPPATQPQPPVEVSTAEEPKEKEKVEIVAIRPQPVTPQPVTPQPATPQPVTSQPATPKSAESKSTTSQPSTPPPAEARPLAESNAQQEGRIRDLENLVGSLQQQLTAAQNTNNSVQINALNEQIARLIAEMNEVRQAAGQPIIVSVATPPSGAAQMQQAAPAPAPAPSAPSRFADLLDEEEEVIAVAVKDTKKKKGRTADSMEMAESYAVSAPGVSDGGAARSIAAATQPSAAGTAASGTAGVSAASAASAQATHGAFIQGRTGPGILLYPVIVAVANGMYFLFRKKKR